MEVSNKISSAVDSWINESEFPAGARLRVIHASNPDSEFTEDELNERYEFIHWYMMQDFVPLLMIPKPVYENDFFIAECDPASAEYSAFNTHDFQDRQKPFDRYGYAMRKVMEKVKDLALLHSCISSEEGRERTYQRFLSLVEHQFRERLMKYIDQYKRAELEERKLALKTKIAEVNRRIMKANEIWERYAPRDC